MKKKAKPITPYKRLHDAAKYFIGDLWLCRQNESRVLVELSEKDAKALAEAVRVADVLGFDTRLRLREGGVVAVATKRVEIPLELVPDFLRWGQDL